jgi:two-component system, chemotaxis family, response regulator PixH
MTTTILVIEDSQSQRELIISYLENNYYRVFSTDNAADGMELAVEQKPDLIITDITMEGINGFEFCRLLKTYPDTQQIPIIACTARNSDLDRLWGQKQGIDVYVTKPYSEEDLINAIKQIIN